MRTLLIAFLALPLSAQAPAVRPKILGMAHMALYVSDLAKAREFYEGLLGFEEPFTLPKPDGSVQIAFVKINDHQYLELFNEPNHDAGQLNHIAVYTDSADRMRDYLASKGIAGVPGVVGKGRIGNKNFTVKDADGHEVEIVEYMADGWSARDFGKNMPARISEQMMHVGVLVGNLEKANSFYSGLLGFREFWRGSAANSPTLSWVNMRTPDGPTYVELMLYSQLPDPDKRGTAHHLCLMVPNMEKALAFLESRPVRKNYTRQIEIRTGINRKRQVNLYDPDGTRVELMEPETVDGKPAPSSTLPPPNAL